jgi:3-oxoacyl-[acyl-carrier protein] reductase
MTVERPPAPEKSRAATAYDLRGRRALVTGGTHGIGRAVVLALAQAGAAVVTCHRRPGPDADSLVWQLKEIGDDHHLVQADVGREEDVARLMETCRSRLGGLDILVNNVGAQSRAAFATLGPDDWRRAVDANLTTAFLVTHGALPLLSRRACVVNVGSRAAEHGTAEMVPYTAAKAGLVGFTRSLAKELGPVGVRVNVVAPGPLGPTEGGPPVPGRPGRADDVAAVVLFLVSDEAGFITGETFTVDGGAP